MLYLIFSIVVAFFMGAMVIVIRMKAQNYPVNEKKIILPPFFMSTGALMYVVPYFRLTGQEMLESLILGVLFSTVLIWTSRFEIKGSDIYMKRSKAFPVILISLLVIRTVMKIFISKEIDPGEIGGMFFLLAFCMIVPWRIAMLYQYKKLKKSLIQ
ncbi:CcdC family protein [Staphylococcus simiae]|uniref:CcdC family protein n=1 Tax=Staphylococcus simiae TaxID=308354 RepID=UPI001A97ACC5|nr:CcdC family protein [Staphylococcus simiae]MBO1199625.1 CcdC family protein [Staphylococcus simiae]MBO1201938.1 CcdC family protein [Staphylococcus simiae]MBO1204153.1 CcdC family protein [Staphylococcus simiae]MBO1211657.1 CcdC family protein [Staphylococcus simiae]MBO1230387.1 CcdC family protein [Staphylococcus simiae]